MTNWDPSAEHLFALGFAPGLFLLWLLVQQLRGRAEPVSLIARTFVFGVFVAAPVVVAELALLAPESSVAEHFGLQGNTTFSAAWSSFVVAGLVEELAKALVLIATLQGSPYLRDRLAGLVFAAAAALGFASIENVGYMNGHGWTIIFARAPTATIGHVVFALPVGYALGAVNQTWWDSGRSVARSWWKVGLGLLTAIALHGGYNFGLESGLPHGPAASLALVVCGVAAGVALWLYSRAKCNDRYKRAPRVLRCARCSAFADSTAATCTVCHNISEFERFKMVCGDCRRSVEPGWAYCCGCGSRLLGLASPDQVNELRNGASLQQRTALEGRE